METRNLLEIIAVLLLGVFTIMAVHLYRDEDTLSPGVTGPSAGSYHTGSDGIARPY